MEKKRREKMNQVLPWTVAGFLLFILLAVLAGGCSFISFCKAASVSEGGKASNGLPELSGDPGVTVENEDPAVGGVIKKVARHVLLPNGQVVVTTVLDPDALREAHPIFYHNAKQGDKVLIYEDRAILYDPAIDRVLDISHIISVATTTATSTPQ